MIQAIALQGAAPTAISLLLIAESVGVDQRAGSWPCVLEHRFVDGHGSGMGIFWST
ncbi:MAG: hypothetical protein CM15mP77_0560 [Synechococcus sp.]|nr:MAG: hypothetical protein CM15mP77_0560 [Synechococcus sp.]